MNSINPKGTIWDSQMPTVIIHQGLKGAPGLQGDPGGAGPKGDSIEVLGNWTSGATYGPLDAVSWRSSVLSGVTSLYVQFSDWPSGPSSISPDQDPGRWSEIGLTGNEGLLGGVWLVAQASHPFTLVGQPAALTSGGYRLASSADPSLLGIAVVREIIDENNLILQSTGELDGVSPAASLQGSFTPGMIYYTAAVDGYLTANAPTAQGQYVNPSYLARTATSGVALPWTPAPVQVQLVGVRSNRERFYYTATLGQTVFTGADDDGNTPAYAGNDVDAFLSGLNLVEGSQYSISGGDTLTLLSGAAEDAVLEIWVTTPISISQSDAAKADTLVFDGTTRTFPLLASAVPMVWQATAGFTVFLDGHPQQPEVDFTIADVGGNAEITFTVAPEVGTGVWIIRS